MSYCIGGETEWYQPPARNFDVSVVVDGNFYLTIAALSEEDAKRQVRESLAALGMYEDCFLSFDIEEV